MKEVDADMMKAVMSALEFADITWSVGAHEVAAQDLINELSVLGYKIVKDSAE